MSCLLVTNQADQLLTIPTQTRSMICEKKDAQKMIESACSIHTIIDI